MLLLLLFRGKGRSTIIVEKLPSSVRSQTRGKEHVTVVCSLRHPTAAVDRDAKVKAVLANLTSDSDLRWCQADRSSHAHQLLL